MAENSEGSQGQKRTDGTSTIGLGLMLIAAAIVGGFVLHAWLLPQQARQRYIAFGPQANMLLDTWNGSCYMPQGDYEKGYKWYLLTRPVPMYPLTIADFRAAETRARAEAQAQADAMGKRDLQMLCERFGVDPSTIPDNLSPQEWAAEFERRALIKAGIQAEAQAVQQGKAKPEHAARIPDPTSEVLSGTTPVKGSDRSK